MSDTEKLPKQEPSDAEKMQRRSNKANHSERMLNGGKK